MKTKLEKIDRIETILRKIKGIEDYIHDMQGLCLFPEAKLSTKFKMFDLEKFDRIGDPKVHLRMYVGAPRHVGIQRELLSQLFQHTLTGPTFASYPN